MNLSAARAVVADAKRRSDFIMCGTRGPDQSNDKVTMDRSCAAIKSTVFGKEERDASTIQYTARTK